MKDIFKKSRLPLQLAILLLLSAIAECAMADEAKTYSTMDSVLYQLTQSNNTETFAKTHGLHLEDNRVRVIIELINDSASIPNEYHIIEEMHYQNLIQALVPIDNLITLSEDANVRFVRSPMIPIPAISSNATDTPVTPAPSTGIHFALISMISIILMFLLRTYKEKLL